MPFDVGGAIDGPLCEAIGEWKALLGDAWVDTTSDRCANLELATFATSGRVRAQLCPGSVEELRGCVRVANRYGVPICVYSRGRNYGYSSSGPSTNAAVAVDLSRLIEISEFDEELGCVRIQAGVTFAQLGDYLSSRGSRRILPSTGGPADGSVLANTVERGHGLGFGGNRYEHSCRYEVITAQGDRFETGFGRFEQSRVANLMRTGVGPVLDGIFTQSSLGVVTAVTLWLPRRPRFHASILIPTRERGRIGALFDAVGEAARQGLIREGCTFAMGAYKLASILMRREDFAAPDVRLTWEDLRRHSRRWGHSEWFLVALIDADTSGMLRAKVKAAKAVFREFLTRAERLVLLTDLRVRAARALTRILPRSLAAFVCSMVDNCYERMPLLGHRIERTLDTVYWAKARSQYHECRDLHGDRVGLLWVSVPVPLRGVEITKVCQIIDDGLLEFGFEPQTQVTLVSERVVRVITALAYDRSQPEQDERAIRCQSVVYSELQRLGYFTYRLQPHLMSEYSALGRCHQDAAARIKNALDPRGILDPGRYLANSMSSTDP